LAQVKTYIGETTTDHDADIATAITAASRAIDRATGRQFGQVATAQARSYDGFFDRHRPRPAWVVHIDDLGDVTGLAVSYTDSAGVTTTITDYTLEPVNALVKGRVYGSLVVGPNAEAAPTSDYPQVDLTGLWGWPAIPATVLGAGRLQTARFHARRDSPFGVAGSPSVGSELRLLAKVDPDVAVMLADYVRRWGAV